MNISHQYCQPTAKHNMMVSGQATAATISNARFEDPVVATSLAGAGWATAEPGASACQGER